MSSSVEEDVDVVEVVEGEEVAVETRKEVVEVGRAVDCTATLIVFSRLDVLRVLKGESAGCWKSR